MRTFEYRHIVTFEDTNVVGNVYYVSHLRWQGRCRELFLREHARELLERLGEDLCLVTTRCSCEYHAELVAFDQVVIRMSLKELVQNRITMAFDYYRCRDGAEELVARGEQQVVTMQRDGERLVPTPVPEVLQQALGPYVSA